MKVTIPCRGLNIDRSCLNPFLCMFNKIIFYIANFTITAVWSSWPSGWKDIWHKLRSISCNSLLHWHNYLSILPMNNHSAEHNQYLLVNYVCTYYHDHSTVNYHPISFPSIRSLCPPLEEREGSLLHSHDHTALDDNGPSALSDHNPSPPVMPHADTAQGPPSSHAATTCDAMHRFSRWLRCTILR